MAEETITTPQETPNQPAKTEISFDYEKLANILAGKQSETESKVLGGYFKQQGLTGEEINQAIAMFKADKAAKEPNVEALTKQASEAIQRALMAETQVAAMNMASELGVEQKVIPYLMKLADMTSVIKDGQIDQESLKENLNKVLADIPQLKITPETTKSGFKVGVDTSGNQNNSTNEELARIFGVAKKG